MGKRFGDDGEGREGYQAIEGREEILASSVKGEGNWAWSLGWRWRRCPDRPQHLLVLLLCVRRYPHRRRPVEPLHIYHLPRPFVPDGGEEERGY